MTLSFRALHGFTLPPLRSSKFNGRRTENGTNVCYAFSRDHRDQMEGPLNKSGGNTDNLGAIGGCEFTLRRNLRAGDNPKTTSCRDSPLELLTKICHSQPFSGPTPYPNPGLSDSRLHPRSMVFEKFLYKYCKSSILRCGFRFLPSSPQAIQSSAFFWKSVQ